MGVCKLYFQNDEHKNNFRFLMDKYHLRKGNLEYESSIYVAALPVIFKCLKDNGTINTAISPLFELTRWDEDKEEHIPCHPALTGVGIRLVEFGISLYTSSKIIFNDILITLSHDVMIEAMRISANKVNE